MCFIVSGRFDRLSYVFLQVQPLYCVVESLWGSDLIITKGNLPSEDHSATSSICRHSFERLKPYLC